MKILIVYASAGAGHRKAAEALQSHLQNTHPEFSLETIDILDYTPKSFKLLYSKGYVFLVSRFPWLWYLLYRISFYFPNNPINPYLEYINCMPFVRLLQREGPRVVVSTHFLVNSIASVYKKRNPDHRLRLISIVTDYTLHPLWIGEGVDVYIASCGYVKSELMIRGVEESRIKEYGIPANEKFYRAADRKDAALKLKVGLEKFTVLIMTGTFGIGPIEEIVKILAGDFQLLVVCGSNIRLYRRLSGLGLASVKVYPLIHNVDELMSVSDVVLTKAGGISITESLAKGLPMVFFANIPGLETTNAKVICSYGAGFNTKTTAQIKEIVHSLKNDKTPYQKAMHHLIRIRKSDTLVNISNEILKFLQN
jgi:processive 1,2-diacylglycerol beta-glucosyltransferase